MDLVHKMRPPPSELNGSLVSQGEAGGAFKGFKGFSLTAASPASSPATFSGFGNGGVFKGLGCLTNGNSSSFGGVSPASSAVPGEFRSAPIRSKLPRCI